MYFHLIIPDDTGTQAITFSSSLLTTISWVWEHNWYRVLTNFQAHFQSKGPTVSGLVFTLVITFQIICSQLVLPLITAVIIEGYKRYRALNEYIFNEQTISTLADAWSQFDENGEGLINIKDYFKLMPSLDEPLTMDPDNLFKRLGITIQDWEDSISSKIVLRDAQGSFQFTTKQFFFFFKVYNVPIYQIESKSMVHFKDVACHLAKMAIENKYNQKDSLHLSSKRIETVLRDMWNTAYPSRVELPDYVRLSENYDRLSQGKDGKLFLGFDAIKYQTVLILQELWQKARAKKIVRNMRMSTIKALMNRQNPETFTEQKIDKHKENVEEHKTLQDFNEIIQQYKTKKAKPYQKENLLKKKSSLRLEKLRKQTYSATKVETSHSDLPYDDYFNIYKDVFKAGKLL